LVNQPAVVAIARRSESRSTKREGRISHPRSVGATVVGDRLKLPCGNAGAASPQRRATDFAQVDRVPRNAWSNSAADL